MALALSFALAASMLAALAGLGTPALAARASNVGRVFDVRGYGALGNGAHDDAPPINRAIEAANRAGGGVVELPPGTYLAGGSIHMLSNVTLRVDAGATVLGGEHGYDPPEPNPYARYEDTGHSHFHDAVIWGEDVHDIGFVGAGTIDGAGHLLTGQPIAGRADKLISLAVCDGLTISGITLERGGHFAILINDCKDVRSNGLRILTADDRDGWDVDNSQDVRITNLVDHAYDDALAFKSEWALGATLPSGDVTVTHAHLSSVCCNALMFGSETCGDFTGYRLSHIVITGAGKSGLGMVSMDGGHISDVDYSDIAMSGVAGPIMEKIGIRRSCGGDPGIGGISDIHYENVTGTSLGTYSPTLWGEAGHAITNVTFEHVRLAFPGGHAATSLAVPSDDPYLYNPDTIGPRPAYAFYLHDVAGIYLRDSSFLPAAGEARPPFVLNEASGVDFERVTAQSGWEVPFDIALEGVSGVRVAESESTGGRPLSVNLPCGLSPPALDCLTLEPWFVS
jgi:Glycosyl hydrolases family 28